MRGAIIHSFIVNDCILRFAGAPAPLAQWVRQGASDTDEHVGKGVENAPPGSLRLFEGGNDGKSILRIAD